MNKVVQEQISKEVDSWIEESEIPASSIKPIKKFHGLYPETEEEKEAYWDFIHWAMNREHELLLSIPVKDEESYFVPFELDEHGNDISAFNTMDFQRLHGFKFNHAYWKLEETMERLFGLAQTHSCVSNEAGKAHMKAVFDEIVRVDFKEKHDRIYEAMRKYPMWVNRKKAVVELAKLQGNIQQAEKIWQKTAYDT